MAGWGSRAEHAAGEFRKSGEGTGMGALDWLILLLVVLVVALLIFVVIRRRRRGGGVFATRGKP